MGGALCPSIPSGGARPRWHLDAFFADRFRAHRPERRVAMRGCLAGSIGRADGLAHLQCTQCECLPDRRVHVRRGDRGADSRGVREGFCATLGGGAGGEHTSLWDRRPCKRAPVWEDREVKLSTKFTTQLTRTKNMTEAFFKCFTTVAHFAGQLDQKNPCGTQARSFMTFYERDASDENRRAFLDKIWERQRELGHVTEEEREVHIALVGDRDRNGDQPRAGPNGEVVGDILDRLPLALQPPFISHQLMGTCFYLGGLLEYLRKARKSIFVVDTETCDRDIIGIPAWLGRSSERQLPAVLSATGEMPHNSDSLTQSWRLLLANALAPEYFANNMLRRLSVNKGPMRLDML